MEWRLEESGIIQEGDIYTTCLLPSWGNIAGNNKVLLSIV